MTLVRNPHRDLSAPAFDIDADERNAMESWHDQTRLDSRSLSRRARIISRYRFDPVTVRTSARLPAPMLGERVIPLSDELPEMLSVEGAFSARQSVRREQLGDDLGLEQIGSLLHLAARETRTVAHPSADCLFSRRSYPSAGGLLSCMIHVLPAANILPTRPYRYDARLHVLVDDGRPAGDFRDVEVGVFEKAPPCALAITATLDRVLSKYGPRGYRFALLEAGHIGQNLVLAATALGLPSLVYGSFQDAALERWLELDGLNEIVVSVVLIGGNMQVHSL